MNVSAVLLLMCVWTTTAVDHRCDDHTRCFNTSKKDWAGTTKFNVEGNEISITAMEFSRNYLGMNCHGWGALDSPTMPRFTTEFKVNSVELVDCPPPTRPLSVALEALNVTLTQGETRSMNLFDLPPEPALTELHFIGLESISWLSIDYKQPTTDHILDIVSVFSNLQTLKIGNVPLPVSEYSRFKSSLQCLILMDTIIKPLPETMKELTYLKNLTLFHVDVEDVPTSPSTAFPATILPLTIFPTTLPTILAKTTWSTKNLPTKFPMTSSTFSSSTTPTILDSLPTYLPTSLDATSPSELENMWLFRWKERRMIPMEHCENLRYFKSYRSLVEEFPSGWVAACPRLEKIVFDNVANLKSLPAGFLRGAISLQVLNFTKSALESLPERLFESAPNLRVVNLSDNRLRTIPATSFLGPDLRHLSLSYNFIDNSVINALEKLTSIIELDLGFNPAINDLCVYNGTSGLKDLIHMERLSLVASNVSHICLDWRTSPNMLEVDLRSTKVNNRTVIEFENETVGMKLNNATTLLGAAPFVRLFDLQLKQRK